MNLLGKLMRNRVWGTPSPPHEGGNSLLDVMSHSEAPATLTVLPIRNGFLICRRIYNSTGPDEVLALFVATAEELGPLLVAEMAAMRLKK